MSFHKSVSITLFRRFTSRYQLYLSINSYFIILIIWEKNEPIYISLKLTENLIQSLPLKFITFSPRLMYFQTKESHTLLKFQVDSEFFDLLNSIFEPTFNDSRHYPKRDEGGVKSPKFLSVLNHIFYSIWTLSSLSCLHP